MVFLNQVCCFFKYKDQKYTFTYSYFNQFLLHIGNCVILHLLLTKKIVILVSNNYEKMLDCALVEKLIKYGVFVHICSSAPHD
jgi:hypothetical protein